MRLHHVSILPFQMSEIVIFSFCFSLIPWKLGLKVFILSYIIQMAQKHLWKSYGTNGAYKTVKDLSFIAVYVCFSFLGRKIFSVLKEQVDFKNEFILIWLLIILLLRIIVILTRKWYILSLKHIKNYSVTNNLYELFSVWSNYPFMLSANIM